jgi:transcriptional regulator with XRE-family HTH domain
MRRVRFECGWTLREVAVLFGCDPSPICRIENGERGTPEPADAAGKLGVPLPYLIKPLPAMRLPAPRTATCACAAVREPHARRSKHARQRSLANCLAFRQSELQRAQRDLLLSAQAGISTLIGLYSCFSLLRAG